MLLHPTTVNKLKAYALEAAPKEAVGLLDGVGKIFFLDNKADDPTNSFMVERTQILMTMQQTHFQISDEVVLWHTHPGGLVGPSTTDMQQKTPFKHHLVVSVIDDDIKLTWY